LEENRSTGYEWLLLEDKLKTNTIWKLVDDEYLPGEDSGEVGAPGIRKFIIKCGTAGHEHINFIYGRPWLFDKAKKEFDKSGTFNVALMEGDFVQLGLFVE
jgi:predicted secreted protein